MAHVLFTRTYTYGDVASLSQLMISRRAKIAPPKFFYMDMPRVEPYYDGSTQRQIMPSMPTEHVSSSLIPS
jgi:hypothetical protein